MGQSFLVQRWPMDHEERLWLKGVLAGLSVSLLFLLGNKLHFYWRLFMFN